MPIEPKAIWENLQKVRRSAPLIHNITNGVVMELTADALLAVGASPVMTEAIEEAAEMAQIASALVLNMGTLTPRWQEGARQAAKRANARQIPIIFDPVGAGATAFRTAAALSLLEEVSLTVIRGNASEIAALSGEKAATKGVDSFSCSLNCLLEAETLATDSQSVVIVSGEIDLITDGKRTFLLRNDHPLMRTVTGMGSIATALIAAFAATCREPLLASVHAMAVTGIAGEMAAKRSPLPGSFKTAFIDALFTISLEEIIHHLHIIQYSHAESTE